VDPKQKKKTLRKTETIMSHTKWNINQWRWRLEETLITHGELQTQKCMYIMLPMTQANKYW